MTDEPIDIDYQYQVSQLQNICMVRNDLRKESLQWSWMLIASERTQQSKLNVEGKQNKNQNKTLTKSKGEELQQFFRLTMSWSMAMLFGFPSWITLGTWPWRLEFSWQCRSLIGLNRTRFKNQVNDYRPYEIHNKYQKYTCSVFLQAHTIH